MNIRRRQRTIRQRLTRSLMPIVQLITTFGKLGAGRLDARDAKRFDAIRNRPLDRAQWRRWYQTNRRYQRKMRALARLTGRPIDQRISSLPRWAVI
jgi:hypothetical protein